ncbi:PLP-dependent aminotransferase family protein [Vibrio sp. JC009]|uniref:MocR-like pyridoxine biosynthesis transcription factor PdxR n=1 Tax=Vibrio sp. JC009 TaxID=2912314 RepID=UPI0023B0C774|nr:PLP-dependent aminotransferase family protein [Vibrio sp. JC009]WED23686.1 PLP-dependent aminotransferase family protein [Vibrio sp. JC009]
MQLIDIGDLALSSEEGSKQQSLFLSVQNKIVCGLWPKGGKLPSTRKLAQALALSRNTVINAYEQLAAEGYIESRAGSGYYVAVELPEQYLATDITQTKISSASPVLDINTSFAPGVPDLGNFPAAKWQRLLQRHASRISLLGNQDIQGDAQLRLVLSDYLASSRSVHCDPERIIITTGAQQALSLALMTLLNRTDTILMEQPGYAQVRKIIDLLKLRYQPVPVKEHSGLDLNTVLSSSAKALYVTPSNQYPMGTTLNTEQRIKLIEWAAEGKRWIIEDDYDSEFQFAHRPYTSLQGLAGQMGLDEHIIYIGSFSKVMFNGLRLGYAVVPESMVAQCLAVKDALTGNSPAHTQAALADFIAEGDLLRHIRKMRRLYKAKHQRMLEAIKHHFDEHVQVISQAAGLHITLKWYGGIDESTWTKRASEAGIIIRPLKYYEPENCPERDWHGAVMGFGNVAVEEIESKVKTLAQLFFVNSTSR